MSRYLLPALALAVAILAGVAYCEGRKAADSARDARDAQTAARAAKAAAATWQAREAVQHARADSVQQIARTDSLRLDSLSRRITITAPGVIEVAGDPIAGHGALPPVVVTVPSEVTDLIEAQRTRNTALQRALAVADSGWAAADSVIAGKDRQLAALGQELTIERDRHSWCGFKCGAVVTLLTIGGIAYVVNKLDHRATPAAGRVRVVQLGASVRVWP